jgi:predicted ribosome quality control (RQC) complex YloA/Tae2 family protein
MKTEEIFISALNDVILFYIGENRHDNFAVIDAGNETDLWFHAKNVSSCHVVCQMPEDVKLTKKQKNAIVTQGGILCKKHTHKLSQMSNKNVEIIYTEIKNVRKLKDAGSVHVTNEKSILI